MSNHGNATYNKFFSSLILEIKSYNGNDPLLPWLRAIRKMKETLPPQLLEEKLPRFLQRCSETFLTDRRYSNDLRYLRIWLQLMDFVDNPKAVLKTMERNRIGMKKSLFYQAYALYYEKMKKFDAADKIYRQGVQNLAEPADELQKSYDQFLQRMERNRKKRLQHGGRIANISSVCAGRLVHHDEVRGCIENLSRAADQTAENQQKGLCPESQTKFVNIGVMMGPSTSFENEMPSKAANNISDIGLLNNRLRNVVVSDCGANNNVKELEVQKDEKIKCCSDDTVVVKFVDTAIIGKSNAEDARHHGLVEPTINTKEAMNAINSMFREPLELSDAGRRSGRNQSKTMNTLNTEFEVFTDESLEDEVVPSEQDISERPSTSQSKGSDANQPFEEPFEIYVDEEETNDIEEIADRNEIKFQNSRGVTVSNSHINNLVFAKPNDTPSELSEDENRRRVLLREDTVVYRFVGSTISDEPKVENVCHHGLVEPTINLKEAMNDINSMFGKPIEYVRKSRSKKQDNELDVKDSSGDFLIYPDDESDNQKVKEDINCMYQKPLSFAKENDPMKRDEVPDLMKNQTGFLILPDDDLDSQEDSSGSSTEKGSDLFENTLCTKEAMAEINKLFAMPMDF